MRVVTRLGVCVSLGLWALCPARAAEKGRKVFVSVDMEGIAGVVTSDQLGPPGFEYERFRQFMTNEALAAVEGARAAGATEFVVADSHGNGQNLLVEKFAKDTRIVRSWPRPLGMMEGIDASFDAVIFVGYHASTVNPQGVRAHTFSSATLADMRLNSASVTEAAFNAAISGHFGVPVVMVSGDDAFVKEAHAVMPDSEAAAVKQALSFHAAATLTPEAACNLIREKAKRGVERARQIKPWKIGEPVTLELRFKNYRPAQLLAYLPIVEQTDARAVRFKGRDILEVSRFLEFVTNYEAGLSP